MSTVLLLSMLLTAVANDQATPPLHITRTNVDLKSYCGPNCLTVFFKLKGKDVSLTEVSNLSEKGPQGASLLGLQKAAQAMGFFAEGVEVSSLKALRKIGCPAIALTRRKIGGEYNHYQLILGFEGDQVMVADPPLRPKILPVKEMEQFFEGKVLLLSEYPITLPKSYRYLSILLLVVGAAIFLLWRIGAGKRSKTTACLNPDVTLG